MKKYLLSLALLFAGVSAVNAQAEEAAPQESNPNAPVITFEKMEHDFGTIQQNGNGTYEFVFTNTGKEPLFISNAKGSCGCTVPSWPKDPIAPGQSASIKVKYDTKRVGPFNKTVTITSNASEKTVMIRIVGNVKKAPEAPTTPTKTPSQATPTAPTSPSTVSVTPKV